MLWVSQVAKTTAGNSYAGMPARDRVVRWELRNESVLLRDVRYDIRADTTDSISNAVEASNLAPIIRSFDVVAWGADKRPVIDVTELFTKDVPEFSARNTLGAGAMDPKRSFVEKVQNFPTNIEVQVLASFGSVPSDRRCGSRTATPLCSDFEWDQRAHSPQHDSAA